MDWDFTKLEIQDNNTHLSALASSSGSTHGVIHQHHHEDTNMVDHDIFSVDLKLGRVMDDHHPHHRHQYGLTLDAAAAAAAYNPTNYHSGSPTMTLMAAPSPPPLPLSSSTRRSRGGSGGSGPLQPVCCLVDGCTSDLSSCREYHRRHRVCERHSKTPVVLVGGEEQRFCQQCSRFHPLSEFDEVKRSCRKRLDGHNRRRRKTQPDPTICNINSSTSPIHNTTGIFTNSSSPGSALMDFIRNAPHLPVFPPPPTPWQIPTPLQPQTRSQVDFLLPSSSSSSSSPPYPFMPYGYGGGDQTTRQRSAPRHNTDNNNIHNHQNSVMCHQIMTNNHHTQPLIENSSMSNDNNINCALSLLSSTAMDTTNGANRSSSSTGINVVAGHPFGGFIAPDHHHHLFSSNSQLQQDFEDGTTGSGNYGAVYHHHHHHHSTGAGTTHNFQQRNHGFGHTDSDGF